MSRHTTNNKCQIYLSNKKRITNRQRKLEARIKKLNEDAKDAIRKSCPVGREKEGIKREQNRNPRVKVVELPQIMESCTALIKDQFIKNKRNTLYFCKSLKQFINIKICKGCRKIA